MDADDVQIGRVLTRREVLVLMGAAGLAVAVGCSDDGSSTPTATSAGSGPAATARGGTATAAATHEATSGASTTSCVVKPALTEGPYFVDEKLNRSDIRSDSATGAVKDGTPLQLAFLVSTAQGACAPLQGATVDIWHCDALGLYSDARDPSFNTIGQNFLRGYQTTDAQGRAAFTTIYPGWYQGRAVHIHFKIRTNPQGETGTEFTSQLFFDDSLTDQVHAVAPYAQKGRGRLQNSGDMIFRQSNGQLTLAPAKTADGYAATFDVGLQL